MGNTQVQQYVVTAADIQSHRHASQPDVTYGLIDAIERLLFWAEEGKLPTPEAVCLARDAYRNATGRYPA